MKLNLEKKDGKIILTREDLLAMIGKEIQLDTNETIHRVIQKGTDLIIQIGEGDIPRSVLDTSIDDLDLSVRAYEFLKKEGVRTVEHILELNPQRFTSYPQGVSDLAAVNAELTAFAGRNQIPPRVLLGVGVYERQTK